MPCDHYTPIDLFARVPSLGMKLDSVLAQMDRLLEAEHLFQAVKADLARCRPRTRNTGGPFTPVEVLPCMLVVKHLHGWSFEQTEQFVADSLCGSSVGSTPSACRTTRRRCAGQTSSSPRCCTRCWTTWSRWPGR